MVTIVGGKWEDALKEATKNAQPNARLKVRTRHLPDGTIVRKFSFRQVDPETELEKRRAWGDK
jgi:hypothetical protein